jgi:RNA polymerase sigma-70 factor (ECF subfamily)
MVMTSTTEMPSPRHQALLATARKGDEDAYRQLVEPFQGELHAHCYRMLGSVHDSEDAFQEALLRAWRGLGRFEGRSSLRSWLYRISTNTCLDVISRRPKRVLPIDYGPSADPHDSPGAPLVESVWVEPFPDETFAIEDGFASPEASYEQRESVELAFIAALQHLPANQRAVLILRAVLGFSAQEVAESLDTSVASVNSALQRARKTIDEKLPDQSQQATLRALGDEQLSAIVERYTTALRSGDVDTILSLLTEDATWSMPPLPSWYRGREAIYAFLTGYPLKEDWRHVRTRANGQLAVGDYVFNPEQGVYLPAVLDVVDFRGDKIKAVTGFLAPWLYERFGELDGTMTPAAFSRFGLPDQIAK